jgi:hypothetical protein
MMEVQATAMKETRKGKKIEPPEVKVVDPVQPFADKLSAIGQRRNHVLQAINGAEGRIADLKSKQAAAALPSEMMDLDIERADAEHFLATLREKLTQVNSEYDAVHQELDMAQLRAKGDASMRENEVALQVRAELLDRLYAHLHEASELFQKIVDNELLLRSQENQAHRISQQGVPCSAHRGDRAVSGATSNQVLRDTGWGVPQELRGKLIFY